jgi:hypothetical protein
VRHPFHGTGSHDNLQLTPPQTQECYMASRALGPLLVAVGAPGSGMLGKTETALNAIPRTTKG